MREQSHNSPGQAPATPSCNPWQHCRQSSSSGIRKKSHHYLPGRRDTAIKIDRRKQRLAGVGQYRPLFPAAALFFASPQGKPGAKFQRRSNPCQVCFIDQSGTHPGKLTLSGAGKTEIQEVTDQKIEDCITEEFQPLVVGKPFGDLIGAGWMRQRLLSRA